MQAVVFGASGGIGSAIVERLITDPAVRRVCGVSRSGHAPAVSSGKYNDFSLDFLDEPEIERVCKAISVDGEPDLVLVTTGLLSKPGGLQPERSYKQQELISFREVFEANTYVPALLSKHIFPTLPRHRKSVIGFLSARVGSISDNSLGGWHAYRASKAALNMLIRNYSIELRSRYPQAICVGLHPGTVDTGLSKPFQKRLPDGQLMSRDTSAEHLLSVCSRLAPTDSGYVYDWKGERIPE